MSEKEVNEYRLEIASLMEEKENLRRVVAEQEKQLQEQEATIVRLEELVESLANKLKAAESFTTGDAQWVPVTVALPKAYVPVLVCRADGHVEQGYKDVKDWWKVYGTRTKRVTHWRPMPAGPELPEE